MNQVWSFIEYLAANILLAIISAAIVSAISIVVGIYGRRIVFHIKRGVYYAINKKISLNLFQMTIASQSLDQTIRDNFLDELISKLDGRELRRSVGDPPNVRILNFVSNKNSYTIWLSQNENVLPESAENITDISLVTKLQNNNLHYREAFKELAITMNEVKQFAHGVLGNELNCQFQSSIKYSDKSKRLIGGTNDVNIIIENGEIFLEGELSNLLKVLKKTMISVKLAIYDMIKV